MPSAMPGAAPKTESARDSISIPPINNRVVHPAERINLYWLRRSAMETENSTYIVKAKESWISGGAIVET